MKHSTTRGAFLVCLLASAAALAACDLEGFEIGFATLTPLYPPAG